MKNRTNVLALILGVMLSIVALFAHAQVVSAQDCTDPFTGASIPCPPAPENPDQPENKKNTPAPDRQIQRPTLTFTPAPCGLPGLPDCPGVLPLNIMCSANLIVTASSASGANVTYPDPIVTGGCLVSSPKVVCAPPSGALFPLGINPVFCSVTDGCGSTVGCAFDVKVNSNPASPLIIPPPSGGSGPGFFGWLFGLIIVVCILGGLLFLRRYRESPSKVGRESPTKPGGDGSQPLAEYEEIAEYEEVAHDGSGVGSVFDKFDPSQLPEPHMQPGEDQGLAEPHMQPGSRVMMTPGPPVQPGENQGFDTDMKPGSDQGFDTDMKTGNSQGIDDPNIKPGDIGIDNPNI